MRYQCQLYTSSNQGQTNGHNLMSYPCQPYTSSNQCQTNGHNLMSYQCQLYTSSNQCQTNGHNLMSYQCQPYTSSNQGQSNGHNLSSFVSTRTCHLLMSTQTLASKRSIKNQWARSHYMFLPLGCHFDPVLKGRIIR